MALSGTDPGDMSVASIEREVNAERARVSDTIDALQTKASIGNVVDQLMKSIGEHGGDAGRSLARTVSDNPLPVILTGVGLAWLMASSAASGAAPRRGYRPPDDETYSRGPAARWDDDAAGAPPAPDYTPSDFGDIRETGPAQPDAWSEISDRASSVGSAASGAASGIAEGAADRASRAAGAVSGIAEGAADQVSRAAGAVRSAGHQARRQAGRAGHGAMDMGRDLQHSLDRLFQDQPLVMGALALAAGAALGGALPRSRTEDEMFGAQSDRLKDTAREIAEEEGGKLKATAGAVADEAMKMADEAAGAVESRTQGGAGMVDTVEAKARDAAGRLKQAATDEAERQDLGRPTALK